MKVKIGIDKKLNQVISRLNGWAYFTGGESKIVKLSFKF